MNLHRAYPSRRAAFAWDWASGIPEMLSEGGNLYLVGHETLGRWDGAAWAFYLPDGLGSIRQATDGDGAVTSSRKWTPFGVEVGAAQAGLGYTGEWYQPYTQFAYLRARWYDPQTGRFTRRDPVASTLNRSGGYNAYIYVSQDPINSIDPSGYFSNEAIARSMGMSSFDKVLQEFRNGLYNYRGKWGLLKVLQEAEIGDTLGGLLVDEFGTISGVRVGQFRCVDGKIVVGDALGGTPNLLTYDWYFDEYVRTERERELYLTSGLVWRDRLQAYYLNGRAFRVSTYTDLPDFATMFFGGDLYAPAVWGGLGFGGQLAYIVDRYGRAYFSISGSFGAGAGPVNLGYSEGYVNRWSDLAASPGDRHIPTEEELDMLIPGKSFIAEVGAVMYFSAEVDKGRLWNDYVILTMGVPFLLPAASVGIGDSITWPLALQWSLNPLGWHCVDEYIPRYNESDIRQQRDSGPAGCGC
jgi:RHS repeat-associated protein